MSFGAIEDEGSTGLCCKPMAVGGWFRGLV